jgi:hypothetical protein
MAKVVYPQECFDKQENGTIFYKDGVLNDELRNVGPGILESWRYNFNEGKQVFRAEGTGPNEGILYEKRLLKDANGNPYWSDWMQIPEGEAHGVSAIAINAGPLRLPNSDGAIKLEITPELLGVFSKAEASGIIDQKINQHWEATHQYVPWPAGDPTQSEPHVWALETFATAKYGKPTGFVGSLYILEAKKGYDDFSTQWIWNTKDGVEQWIQIQGGDALEAWVSQREFDAHAKDNEKHVTKALQDKWNSYAASITNLETTKETKVEVKKHTDNVILHVTQADKDKWNAAAPLKTLQDHVNDVSAIQPDGTVNQELVRHVSPVDRRYWDAKMNGEMPNKDKRYVARLGEWTEAYEQVELIDQTFEETIFQQPVMFDVRVQQYQIPYSGTHGTFQAAFDKILTSYHGNIDKVTLTMGAFNTFGLEGYFHTEDINRFSPRFSDADKNAFTWEIGPAPFRNLFVEFSTPITNAKPAIGGIIIKVEYRKKSKVQIGDLTHEMPLDLVGAPGVESLTYNGQQIAGLGSTYWGDIVGAPTSTDKTGTILDQKDLVKFIEDSVSNRLEVPSNIDNHHWVLTHGDVWALSLIQPENVSTETRVYENINIPTIKSDNTVNLTDALKEIFTPLTVGRELVSTKVEMRNVTADTGSNGIYFEAIDSNGKIVNRSPVIDYGATIAYFEWTIPLVKFDKIVVRARRTDSVQALSFIDKMTVTSSFVSYDSVSVSVAGKKTNVFGTDISVLGTGKIKTTGTDYDITGANYKITGKKFSIEGDNSFDPKSDIALKGTALKDFFFEKVADDSDKLLKHDQYGWKWPLRQTA